jgi:hypothetical protein
MRWSSRVLTCCVVAILLSCGGIGLAHEERLVDDLGLVGCDSKEQMAITDFAEGGHGHLISAAVFDVGWDHNHLVAKRHPADGSRIDRTRTEYFIIEVRSRRVYGPFDEPDYVLHCDILGLAEGVAFTRTFPELE